MSLITLLPTLDIAQSLNDNTNEKYSSGLWQKGKGLSLLGDIALQIIDDWIMSIKELSFMALPNLHLGNIAPTIFHHKSNLIEIRNHALIKQLEIEW